MDAFLAGTVFGLIAALCIGLAMREQYIAILRGKADFKFRTPEKLGDAFFYIVPESEYVVLDGLRIEARRVLEKRAAAVGADRYVYQDRRDGGGDMSPRGGPLRPGS